MLPDDDQNAVLIAGLQRLSELFWGPNLHQCQAIMTGTYLQPLAALEDLLKFDPPDGLQKIVSGFKRFSDADALFQYLEAEYVRLFISHRDGIAAPLYESCYVGVEAGETASLMGAPAMMMKMRLQANGLSLGEDISEPPDHIAIELEYLYFLLEKGWTEGRPTLFNEAVSFAADTMRPWISKFRKRLAGEPESRFYFFIASILMASLGYIGEFDKLDYREKS